MRLYVAFWIFAATVYCAPISSVSSSPSDSRQQTTPSARNGIRLHPAVEIGLISSLTAATLAAFSIGMTEYLSSLHDRWTRKLAKLENKANEAKFDRERQHAVDEHQNTGLDIVLDLVESYLDTKAHRWQKSNEANRDLVKDAEFKESLTFPEEEGLAGRRQPSTSESMLPLPRLPGFPPLSEQAPRYAVRRRSDDRESIGTSPSATQGSNSDSGNGTGCTIASDSPQPSGLTDNEECTCELHHPPPSN
jgi:hypothetical protein